MRPLPACGMAVLLAWTAGCARHHFELELRPQGAVLDRTLVFAVDSNAQVRPGSDEAIVLRRLQDVYRQEPATVVDRHRRHAFQGRFEGATPPDVGGAGSLTHFTSPLGSATFYVERFGGLDDVDVQLADLRRGADRLVDLLLGWIQLEMADDPHYEQVRQAIHQDVRQDVRNLAHFWWLAKAASRLPGDGQREFLLRAFQYLVERRYVQPADLPQLARLAADSDARGALRLLREALARKAGLHDPAEIQRALGCLADPEKVAASWQAYLQTTDEYARMLARWQRNPTDGGRPVPEDVFHEIVRDAQMGVPLLRGHDDLKVTLHVPATPLLTNGEYSELDRQVVWTTRPIADRDTLPTLVYAHWCEPDAAFQRQHFGGVILAGQPLVEYVLWYRSLQPGQMRQWDALLEEIRPDTPLRARLQEFRFTSTESDEAGARLAERGAALLLAGVGEK